MQVNYFFLTQTSAKKVYNGKSKINSKIDSMFLESLSSHKLRFDREQSKYWKVDRQKDKQIWEEFSSTINWIWVSFCNASMAIGSDEINRKS